MKTTIAALFLSVCLTSAGQAQTSPRCFGNGDVTSPDGNFSAKVMRSGRSTCGESKVEIYSGDGHLLTIADYTSSDGTSGEGVIKAEWSPDSRYLVFSLSQPQSGKPGPYTIAIFSTQKNKVKTLPVSKPDFVFNAGALELTGGDGQPVRLPLNNP